MSILGDGVNSQFIADERASAPSAPASGKRSLFSTAWGWLARAAGGGVEQLSPVWAATADGRLTLTSGTPITTADVTAATTLYYTPYIGEQIALYDPTFLCWRMYTFTERSLSLSGLVASRPHDIFIWNNAGTLTLEAVAWTSDTARATALVTQNNILVKNGDASRRYLGTIRTTAVTGQTENSSLRAFVANYYNLVERVLSFTDGSSHTYNSATVRNWNNSAAVRVELVIGVVRQPLFSTTQLQFQAGAVGVTAAAGIGINSAALSGFASISTIVNPVRFFQSVGQTPVLGLNYVQGLEAGDAGSPPTFQLIFNQTYVWQ